MLKDKKLEYQAELEEYLEDQKVYDIFEDMMKSLIMAKPENPIQFLLKKLTTPDSKYNCY
jgi:adenylate kinase